MGVPRLTTPQLERVIASLHGLRITGVDYALLTGGPDGHDGHDLLEWNYGAWHEPTMGIQLNTDIGAVFTLTWGSSFGCYGLETHDRGIEDFLARVGEPYGPTLLPVAEHPHWRQLIGREIIGTELAWVEWVTSDPTPCWLRLDLAMPDAPSVGHPESLWVCAGRWERDRFAFATDDVTVVFDRAEAARTGIMTNSRSSAPTAPRDGSGRALTDEESARLRRRLHFGQQLRGRVEAVPRPGAIGVFVDVGLPVGGFVDVLLPFDLQRWPSVATETDFEVWWVDDRKQIRLKPVEPGFLREDFEQWQAERRPNWEAERGRPVHGDG